MRLHRPHIWMQLLVVQPVRIGLLLCIQHEFVQLIDGKFTLVSFVKYSLFKNEAAGNVHDDLTIVLQRPLQDRKLFVRFRYLNRGSLDNRLTEYARRLGKCHWGEALQELSLGKFDVVVGMS